jgi:hypothetical protein
MVNEAVRQALELQAMLLAARPKPQAPGHSRVADHFLPGQETKDRWCAGAVGSCLCGRETK